MKRIYLAVEGDKSILAVMNGERLEDISIESTEGEDLIGRIYKGVVKSTLPSVHGIFVDIGIGENAFLRTKDLLPGMEMPTEGSTLLVQVVTEGTALKGPLVTTKINLSGTYGVALAGSTYIGVSKKIREEEKRKQLRNIAKTEAEGLFGVIIRTAAEKVEEILFKKDMERLRREWDILQNRYRIEKAPALLWREKDIGVKALQEFATDDTEAIITNDKAMYDRLLFLNGTENILDPSVIQWKDDGYLMKNEGVEEELQKLFQRRVDLASGGFLIMDYTEALTVIDVNSGSFQGRGIPHEELAYLINKEAAIEIARQIKLRSLGGMILVDFIDMKQEKAKEKLLHILQEEVGKDRAKPRVCGMTSLGLVEITRKRTGRRIDEFYYDNCMTCGGTGRQLSIGLIVEYIYRDIKKLSKKGTSNAIEIQCHPDVAKRLKTDKEKERLSHICHRNVTIKENPGVHREVYSLLAGEG